MGGQDDPAQEERQEEMYTHVFEGQYSALRNKGTRLRLRVEMLRTVISSEGNLFNQDERLIFSRYGKLSCESCPTRVFQQLIRPVFSGCPPHSRQTLYTKTGEMVPSQRPRWLPETFWGQDSGNHG